MNNMSRERERRYIYLVLQSSLSSLWVCMENEDDCIMPVESVTINEWWIEFQSTCPLGLCLIQVLLHSSPLLSDACSKWVEFEDRLLGEALFFVIT